MYETYRDSNLRYSQMAPLDMYKEANTGSNLPAQIELYAVDGDEYDFLFMAKGGGSANKSFLYQETKALLNPKSLLAFVEDKLRGLGTAACPPYHLALVVGGLTAEQLTAIATGQLAPWRGNRITRASCTKYLPPNCAPMPVLCAICITLASHSRSRYP